MVRVLEDKREAIAEACARFGVARLDAFGSALRDDFCLGESDVAPGRISPHESVCARRCVLRAP